jgi:phytoene desaturase
MADPAPPRAAVIGSGFGGLAAAIRLATAGMRVTVFEARDLPGGRAYVYKLDGHTFDAGPTVITAPHCLEELFAEAGRRLADYVELLPVTPFYRLCWTADGATFDYDGDRDRMLAQIRARRPEDADGYLRFLDHARRVFEAGYVELAHTPFPRFTDMLRVAPRLASLRADRSVYRTVARYVEDEHLREALSFHSLLIGGNPYETSSIYTLIHHLERTWGVFFPRGGTGALVGALTRLLGELGGELRLSSPVTRVRVQDRGGRPRHLVTTARVADEEFDLVVSNADLHHTYAGLYAGEPDARPMVKRLERMDWSMSLYVLYFGTDRGYAEQIAHHTVVFGPRYRGLLDDIFHGRELADDFSLYLHAPHVTDPSLAPPGGGTFYVLSPVPHLGHAPLDWRAAGEAYGDRILAALERLLPELRRHVVVRRHFTPADFQHELGAYHGSAFSVAPRLLQSAYFRPHNKDDRIPGLYLVGAGTHPGAGVPGVINGAKATCREIAKDFGGSPMTSTALVARGPASIARATIAQRSRSFALASALLGRRARDRAAIVYTWCRRADDAVDTAGPGADHGPTLARLRRELDDAYAGTATDPVLAVFGEVARARAIPRRYPEELLAGMAMDAAGTRYATLDDLLRYCWRVAGVVGLMMSHVFGVSDDGALPRAAHLGIAMQLTNICRDVAEDWERGRLYLPDELLAARGAGGLARELGASLPAAAHPAIAAAVADLLALADRYYRSGDRGVSALPWRAALAVRAARGVYSAIGGRIARAGHDVLAGRAVVPAHTRLARVAGAVGRLALSAPLRAARAIGGRAARVPRVTLELRDVPPP